jgi:hypothetical protein
VALREREAQLRGPEVAALDGAGRKLMARPKQRASPPAESQPQAAPQEPEQPVMTQARPLLLASPLEAQGWA